MKIVYSYVPYTNPQGLMEDHLIGMLYLGVLKCRQFYEKVEIYTTPTIANQIKKLKIPFTKIDDVVLRGEKSKCPSIPKLKTYSAQTEPYIHIDIDVILFTPVLFNPHIPVSFAHPDLYQPKLQDFVVNSSLQEAYLEPLLSNLLPSYYKKNVKLDNIPNMNTVVVQDPVFFKKCVDKSLKLYEENEDYFNSNYYKFCTIEQLSIYAELIEQHPNYQKLFSNRDCFLHEGEPLTYTNQGNLPTEITINTYNKRTLALTTQDDIKLLLKENYGGYAHFTFFKECNLTQTIIIQRIVEEFGLEPIKQLVIMGYPQTYLENSLTTQQLSQLPKNRAII